LINCFYEFVAKYADQKSKKKLPKSKTRAENQKISPNFFQYYENFGDVNNRRLQSTLHFKEFPKHLFINNYRIISRGLEYGNQNLLSNIEIESQNNIWNCKESKKYFHPHSSVSIWSAVRKWTSQSFLWVISNYKS